MVYPTLCIKDGDQHFTSHWSLFSHWHMILGWYLLGLWSLCISCFFDYMLALTISPAQLNIRPFIRLKQVRTFWFIWWFFIKTDGLTTKWLSTFSNRKADKYEICPLTHQTIFVSETYWIQPSVYWCNIRPLELIMQSLFDLLR